MPSARTELVDVFLDYENVRKVARKQYCALSAPAHFGMVHPVKLAQLLCDKRKRPSKLRKVYVYRGRPNPQRQPEAASFFDAAVNVWERDDRCSVVSRPLKYAPREDDPTLFRASEKGIDVALAIDVVKSSLEATTNTLVVFSTDTDLLPAIEFAYSAPATHIEVACWEGANPLKFSRQSGKRIWCHNVTQADFRSVCTDEA